MGTTTPNLGLYKPAVGETGWGALVDGNFDTIDSAVAAASSLGWINVVTDYGADPTGAAFSTTEIQAAVTAGYHNLPVFFPPGTYKLNGTISVPSDSILIGSGDTYDGTFIKNTTDDTIFYCMGLVGSGVKINTRIIIRGFKFHKASSFTTTQFCIDMTSGSMDEVSECSFGDHTFGCMNGIDISGGAHWIRNCRFLSIGRDNDSGVDAAIRATGSDVTIASCQIERPSKVLLTDGGHAKISGGHFESSSVICQNTSAVTIRDCWATSTLFAFDNRSNRCAMENIMGTNNRLVNWGMNKFDRINVDSFSRDLLTFDLSPRSSPVKPTLVGTAYNSTYQQAYGSAGDYLLLVIEATNPKNTSSTTDTVVLKNTLDGSTVWTSPSVTVTAENAAGDVAQTNSIYAESYTFWAFVQVPTAAGSHLALSSSFKCRVWCGRAINANPIPTTINNWSASNSTGFFSNNTSGSPAIVGGHLTLTPVAATAFAVTQYMPFPDPPATSYMLFALGDWADDQTFTVVANNVANNGGDNEGVRSQYRAGDNAYNLQLAGDDKQLVAVASERPTSNNLTISLGGFAQTNTSAITILSAAVIPLTEKTSNALLDGVSATGSGHTVSLQFTATPDSTSGAQGLRLQRDTTTWPVGIVLGSDGAWHWDTCELDTGTTDLVLAYDHSIPGDVLRLRQGATVLLGDGIGQPTTTRRLAIHAVHAADTATTMLYMSAAAVAANLANFAIFANGNQTVFNVNRLGFTGIGRAVAGEFSTTGSLEVQNSAGIFGTNRDCILRFSRDGTSTQKWDVKSESTDDSFQIYDNTANHVVVSVGPGSTASSLVITSGAVKLGTSAGTVGFFGQTGTTRVVLATGASHTVDDVITALQNLGLVKQS